MKRPLLIADSGGTKTDWCFIDELGNQHYFSSESYHPSNWSVDFTERIAAFWEQRPELKKAQVHLFCAGCLNPTNALKLESIFFSIGFQNVTVKSDLHAAGFALFGKNKGTFAILGTGSVLVDWDQKDVVTITGGRGHIDGDEGSGFYFGKLVYEAFLHGTLSQKQMRVLERNVDLDLVKEKHRQEETKYVLADIAFKLKNEQLHFIEFHSKNIRAFYRSALEKRTPIELSIIGGYYYQNNAILEPILNDLGVQVLDFQHKPIHALVDYMTTLIE